MKKSLLFAFLLFVSLQSFAVDIPNPPVITPKTIENGENTTLEAIGCVGNVNWFNLKNGGNKLFTGEIFTTPNLFSTTNYFADCNNSSGTSLRSVVKVTVNGGINPILIGTISPLYYCTNGTVTVPFTSTLPSGTVFTLQLFQDNQVIQTIQSETSPITLVLDPNYVITNHSLYFKILTEDFSSLQSHDIYTENFSSIRIHDGLLNTYNGDILCPGKTKILHSKFFGLPTSGPLIFKWFKDNILIPNAIDSTLTISEGGVYKVSVGETCSANSNDYPVTMTTNIWGSALRNNIFDIACINTKIDLIAWYYSNSATYQWQKDGVDIPNATARIFKAGETGNFAVKVFDGECYGPYQEQKLTFTTGIFAPIHSESGDTTICGGKSIKLVTINGNTPNYTYQWIKDGVNIEGATAREYSTSIPGKYQVGYTVGGCVSKSKEITLVENSKAQIPVILGSSFPDICSGSMTIHQKPSTNSIFDNFQNLFGNWFKNNISIPNSYSNSYTATESGSYHMVYGEGNCAVESNHVTITTNSNSINPKIIIYSYPKTTNLCGEINSNNFIALRLDEDYLQLNNLHYQWRLNGVNIEYGTGSLMFAILPGIYDLVVSNGSCIGISNPITITNNNTIKIYSEENNIYCTNRAVILNVDANNYVYDHEIIWKRDNIIIPNETGTTLYALTGGEYTATINSLGCNAISEPHLLKANIPNNGFTSNSGNWNDPLCWICGQLPNATTAVKISNGHIINVPAGIYPVKNVTLEGTVNFETGGEVKVTGN